MFKHQNLLVFIQSLFISTVFNADFFRTLILQITGALITVAVVKTNTVQKLINYVKSKWSRLFNKKD